MEKRSYEYRKAQVNKRCVDCGILIYQYSERCRKCAKNLLKLDNKRKLYLESLGYNVIVIWETDIRINGFDINTWVKNI
jgi:hypothetical protein